MFIIVLPLMFTSALSFTPDVEEFRTNWTTCEEFLAGTELDIMKIINIDWRIFYFFNPEYERSYKIRFRLPDTALLERFRMGLGESIEPKVNWSAAELFMETTVDLSALFIRTEVSGLYYLIPSLAFERDVGPMQEFALKLVEPWYLGFVNCWYRRAYVLAPYDRMPKEDELDEAAAKINFVSDFKRSYLETSSDTISTTTPEPYKDTADDRDDLLDFDEERSDILYLF